MSVEETGGPGNFIVYDVEFDDVNADGFLDAFVTYLGADEREDELLLGQEGGAFARVGQMFGSTQAADVELGDFNGDGRLDAFFGYAASVSGAEHTDRVWLGAAEGLVDSGQRLGDSDTEDVGVGDFNEDGIDDVVTVGVLGRALYFGAADGVLIDSGTMFGDGGARSVRVADLNADGHLDLLIRYREVWLGRGDGRFDPADDVFELERPIDIGLADLNGDGFLDAFVVQNRGQSHHVYLGDGQGGFARTEQAFEPMDAAALALGDFNNDGFVDAFIANGGREPNRIFLGAGDGVFWDSHLAVSDDITWEAEAVDANGDGVTDVAIADRFGRSVEFLLSQPRPDDLLDGDGDGAVDCDDPCRFDADKVEPGLCGCGTVDDDTDSDGTPDCMDRCVDDPVKTEPGACGCGLPETDSDTDTVPDCADNCPELANEDQADADMNGVGDACEPVPPDGGMGGEGGSPDAGTGGTGGEVDQGLEGEAGAPARRPASEGEAGAPARRPARDDGGCTVRPGANAEWIGWMLFGLGVMRRRGYRAVSN